jgi:DnaK suppressor protein
VAKKVAPKTKKPTTKPASKVSSKSPKKPASKPQATAKKPVVKKVATKALAKTPASKVEPIKPVAKAVAKPAPKPVPKAVAKGPVKPALLPKGKVDPKAAKPGGGVLPPTKASTPPSVARKGKPPVVPVMPAGVSRLMDMKGGVRKPLISSGPKAAHVKPLGAHNVVEDAPAPIIASKSTLTPEQLAEFRELLIAKRAVLVGDVHNMESQALTSGSGSLSNMPSHLAEQGSEAYDQSLSLDLAAADRKLIKEIDDAIQRIDVGTYGICEATGKPIKLERLRELPWARYSIEAAREIERQSMRSM